MSDNRSSNRGGGVKLPSKRNKIISIALVLMLSATVFAFVDCAESTDATVSETTPYEGCVRIDNKGDATWDPALPAGTGISYDKDTKTLTLDHAKITAKGDPGSMSVTAFICNTCDIVVKLVGVNSLTLLDKEGGTLFFTGRFISNSITFIGNDPSKDSLKITAKPTFGTDVDSYSFYTVSEEEVHFVNCGIEVNFEPIGSNPDFVSVGFAFSDIVISCVGSKFRMVSTFVPTENGGNEYFGFSASTCNIADSEIEINLGQSNGDNPSFGLKVQPDQYSITNTNLDIKVADSKADVYSSAIIVSDGSAVPLSTFSYAKSVKGSTTHGAALTDITGDITSEYRDIYVEYVSKNAPADNSLAVTAAIVASVVLLVLTFFIVLLSRRRREDD